MSDPNPRAPNGKDLLQQLRRHGLTEYGSTFHGDSVRTWLDLEMPETGTKQAFDSIALKELSAIDYCRNALLNEGKYLTQDGSGYRVLLPSENRAQVDTYMNHADNKLKRALKLLRNTPAIDTETPDNTEARLTIKRETLKRTRYGDVARAARAQ
jgi:hypothetical protein